MKIDVKGLAPVAFADSKKVPIGNWLAAAGVGATPTAVGIVSVMTRDLGKVEPGEMLNQNRGFLGILLDEKYDGARGAKIASISDSSSGAGKAGLKKDDVIIEVNRQVWCGSADLAEAACFDVVQKSAHVETGEVRPRPDALDVGADGCVLIAGDEERQATRVWPSGFVYGCVDVVFASGRHAAVRVCDDHGSVDAEQVRGENERAEDVVGDTGAGVAQDLRVAGHQTEHGERLDA